MFFAFSQLLKAFCSYIVCSYKKTCLDCYVVYLLLLKLDIINKTNSCQFISGKVKILNLMIKQVLDVMDNVKEER